MGIGGPSASRPSLMNTARRSVTWHPEQMNVWCSTPRTGTVSSGTTLVRISSAPQAVQSITRTPHTHRPPGGGSRGVGHPTPRLPHNGVDCTCSGWTWVAPRDLRALSAVNAGNQARNQDCNRQWGHHHTSATNDRRSNAGSVARRTATAHPLVSVAPRNLKACTRIGASPARC
jgi:hypothetical protein